MMKRFISLTTIVGLFSLSAVFASQDSPDEDFIRADFTLGGAGSSTGKIGPINVGGAHGVTVTNLPKRCNKRHSGPIKVTFYDKHGNVIRSKKLYPPPLHPDVPPPDSQLTEWNSEEGTTMVIESCGPKGATGGFVIAP